MFLPLSSLSTIDGFFINFKEYVKKKHETFHITNFSCVIWQSSVATTSQTAYNFHSNVEYNFHTLAVTLCGRSLINRRDINRRGVYVLYAYEPNRPTKIEKSANRPFRLFVINEIKAKNIACDIGGLSK